MRRALRAPVALFLMAAIWLPSCGKKQNDPTKVVVVKVNESEFLAKEFAEELSIQLKDLTALSVKDPYHIQLAKDKVVNEFIYQTLTRDWAKKNDIKISKDGPDGWQKHVDKIMASYKDEISFREALAESGQTRQGWEAKIRFDILQRQVIAKLAEKMTAPTNVEINSYYNANKKEFTQPQQIKIQQIVLKSESDAKRILQELKKRRPMEELAKKFSITPEGKNGGQLGWIDKGTAAVFDSGFQLSVGARSSVLKSEVGYHIFEVVGKRDQQTLPLKEVTEQIKRNLLAQQEQAFYSKWLEEQIRNARVYKNIEFINNMIVETKEN